MLRHVPSRALGRYTPDSSDSTPSFDDFTLAANVKSQKHRLESEKSWIKRQKVH